MKSKFFKLKILQRIIGKFPAIKWNRPNVILFHDTIPLKATGSDMHSTRLICFSFYQNFFSFLLYCHRMQNWKQNRFIWKQHKNYEYKSKQNKSKKINQLFHTLTFLDKNLNWGHKLAHICV
jgi:hypothetical protein